MRDLAAKNLLASQGLLAISMPAMPSPASKPAAKKKPAAQPATRSPSDADSAEAALAALTPRLLRLAAETIDQPRVDVRAAASFVLSEVVPRVTAPALARRLQSLPAAEFDFSAVADLKPAALAVLASQAEQAATAAQSSGVRLPAELHEEATLVKARMLKVCAHQFEDHPRLGAEVADIRAGVGYLDLAEDLLRLAALYKTEAATVALDRRYYDTKDLGRARALAERITGELRHGQSGNAARDLAWRAYAFLEARYEEVASACRFLERKAGGAEQYPSLRAATGQNRRRRTKDSPEPPPAQPPASA